MSFSEQIKADIIKCFKDRKPVLLHSDNNKNVFNRVRLVQKFHTMNGGVLEPPVEFIETKEESDYDAFIIKKSVILSEFLGGLRDKARTVIEYKLKEGLGQELGFNVQKGGVIRIGRSKAQDWLEPDEIDVEVFNQRREKLAGTNPEAALKLYKKEMEIVDSVPFFYGLEDRENQIILETIWSEVRNHFESTKKVYRRINCNSWNGKKVYNLLTQKAPWVDIPVPGYLKNKDIMVPFFDSILFDYKGTVFLNNLSCDPESEEDDKHYQNIVNIIRKKPDCWLIAYTDNPEYFPGEFTDPEVFKSIRLSDIGVSSVTEDKNGERKILGFAESTRRSSDKETVSFPTPHNSKWTEVEMFLIDKDHFKIIIKPIEKVVTYSQMGFKKEKSIIKTKLWGVLLRFATANNSQVGYYAEKTEVEKDIQRLNVVLIRYFGITGNPIKHQGDKKGYVAEFKIYDNSYLQEHINSKQQVISEEEGLDEKIDKDINDSSA